MNHHSMEALHDSQGFAQDCVVSQDSQVPQDSQNLQDLEDTTQVRKAELPNFEHIHEIESILRTRLKDFAFHALKDIPHPSAIHNNMEASLLVCQSMLRNEKIVIVGDYDADGICATCIMLDFFEEIGYSNVSFAMPNRFIHGYGFSVKLFEEILRNHADVALIITVDNGVSSFDAGLMCQERNIRFIITDHHTLEVGDSLQQRIPPCDFLINPQQAACSFPYKDICGSLVAWYFCCAIKISMQALCMNPQESASIHANCHDSNEVIARIHHYESCLSLMRMESLLLLVGIAIIADVMPLNAMNHTICRYALKYIPRSNRASFQVFMEHVKYNMDSQTLGFRLIPLLNAAGRISDGRIALSFLRARSHSEARHYFKQLKDLNQQRKSLQDEVTNKAFQSIQSMPQNENMLCAVGDDWHEGVLGIVAGKMADEFQKPCFVLTNINGVCKGSGRSYGDVDLIASMQKIGHLMQRYGGHVGAVGLEIKDCDIQSFIRSFEPINCQKEQKDDVLGILESHLLTDELLSCIALFEPYGNANPLPKFLIELPIIDCRKTGQGFIEFHFQCVEGRCIKGMFFNQKYAQHHFSKGDIMRFRATIGIDCQPHSSFNPAFVRHNTPNQHIMLIIDTIYGI